MRPPRTAGHFVARFSLDPDAPERGNPFGLPVVGCLRAHGRPALGAGVTFLVGENGSGKSTLVEALAAGRAPRRRTRPWPGCPMASS